MELLDEDYTTVSTPADMMSGRVDSATSIEEEEIENIATHDENSQTQWTRAGSTSSASARCCGISCITLEKQLPVVVSIAIGAYVGVGVRMLLTELADAFSSSQAELLELLGFSYFLPNVFGCFVMGVAGRLKPLLREQYTILVTGVTTGFCGCCTTFASWELGVAAMFIHGQWLNALLVLCVQIASSMVSFRLGYHVGEGVVQHLTEQLYPLRKPPVDLAQLKVDLERNISNFRAVKIHSFPQLVARRVRATEESLFIARDSCSELLSEIVQVEHDHYVVRHNWRMWLFAGVFLSIIFWAVLFVGFSNYARSRLLALCFGPFGALLRYYLSLKNSLPRWKNFPLFTFIPNVIASALSCVVVSIGSKAYQDSGSSYRIYVLIGEGGIMVGFLGSLSTVSTWVNELQSLSSRRLFYAYRYAIASVLVSQLASVFLLGMWDSYGNAPLIV